MARPEHNLQAACWVYAQQVLPPEADFASVETKVGRDDRLAAVWRKQVGIRAGQPDAQLVYKGRVTFIEFKAGASVTDAQHRRHAALERAGAATFVVRSVQQFHDILCGLGVQLRYHALTPADRDLMLAGRRPAKPGVTRRNPAKPDLRTVRRVAAIRARTMF